MQTVSLRPQNPLQTYDEISFVTFVQSELKRELRDAALQYLRGMHCVAHRLFHAAAESAVVSSRRP